MKKLTIYISTFALFMLSTVFAPAAAAIGATPLRMNLQAAPGETVEGYVIAQNTSDETQEVVLTKGDFRVREDESMQFLTEVDPENEWSMQEWMELTENNVVVDSDGMRELRYKITVPEDAKSQSYYGVVFVSGKSPNAESGAGVGISTNVAHLVLFEVTGNLNVNLELKGFEMVTAEDNAANNEVRFETIVYNNGNTHTVAEGAIIITDEEQNIIEEIPLNKNKFSMLPSRNKTMVEKWSYKDFEPGNYYAYLSGETKEGIKLNAEMSFEVTKDGKAIMVKTQLNKSLQDALRGDNPLAQLGNALGLAFIAVIFMLIVRYFTCGCHKKNCKKGKKRGLFSIFLITFALGNLLGPNVLAQDLANIDINMTVDVGTISAISFDGCWHDAGGDTWSFDITDTTANLRQPGDRETGAPTGDQYGWYDTAGNSANGNLISINENAFGYDDCRIKVTATGWSNYEVTLHGEQFDDVSATYIITDMTGSTGSGFDFVLDNENPSTPYPSTDDEHGFFIVDKSAGITQTVTDNGPGDVYITGKAYDATDCGTRPCYHHIPNISDDAVTIIDETAGELDNDTFVLRFGAGIDPLTYATTYNLLAKITLNTTP